MTERRVEHRIDADHPCLAGHFPGNPIVPGVVLIDQVLASVRQEVSAPLAAIPNLKFLHPVRPGVVFSICWTIQGDTVRFRCESDAEGAMQLHVQGVLSFKRYD